MVWFYCDDCGDTIKKPKLATHFRTCHGQTFTCVDCSRSFDRSSAGGHSTCVSEHEKYALGATKPGGYASAGFFKDGQPQPEQPAATSGDEEVVGAQFLSQRPPWKCNCCNVNCTSRETLLGHAAGAKHKRRARAARGLSGQQQQQQQQENRTAAGDEQPADTPQAAANATAATGDKRASSDDADHTAAEDADQPLSKKQKKDKRDKKDNCSRAVDTSAAAASEGATQQAEQRKASKKKSKKSQAAAATTTENSSDKQQQATDSKEKKQKSRRSKDSKQSDREQQEQELPDLGPLLAVAKKKLKKKGKLGFKKLQALLKQNANGGYNEAVVAAVREQLLAAAEVQLKDDDLLVWQDSN